ncbi:MAG: GNAT family N-acetyltransferase [Hydrogenophilales bacterium]
MTFTVEISYKINENFWNDNLSKNIGSTIYQSYNWQKLYHEAFDSKPVFVIVFNESKTVVGQLACLIHGKMLWENSNYLFKKIKDVLKMGNSLWWYHGPIIHDEDNQDEILSIILSSIDKIAKENNVENIRGISSPLTKQFSPHIFQKNGYIPEQRLTFIIDLNQNIDDLYSSLKKDTRYYIRKSEKENFEFEIANDMEGLTKFQDFKIDARKKEGRKAVRNPEFYEKHWKILQNNGFEEWLLAKDDGQIKGTILTLFFNGNVIQHALANSPGEKLVGTFLTWNTIKWAQKKKLKTFDFAGVDPSPKTKKEKGIYFYAEKFGGEKINFFSYTKIVNRKKFYFSSSLQNPNKIISKYHKFKQKKIRKKDGNQ